MIINKQLFRTIYIVLFLGTMPLLIQCKQSAKGEATIARDTTINQVNAYSSLFLDSLIIDSFIVNEVPVKEQQEYLRDFYNSRNYSFAWFNKNGLTVQAEAFWNAHKMVLKRSSDSTVYDNALHTIVDTLLSDDSTYRLSREALALTELRFTKHFFDYVQYAYEGKVDPKQVQWHIPRRKLQPIAMLDSFLNNKNGQFKPLSKSFQLLQNELIKYRTIEQQGGWNVISTSKRKFKVGDVDSIIAQVKSRLAVTGVYDKNDTSATYTSTLSSAVRNAQASFGLKQDGIIDAELIRHLNVPIQQRIKQMLINAERMKWMPQEPAKYLLANIPEYRLHVVENGKEVMGMNIVVGKAANRSVIFSDELKYVVFSPYWNIPRSIVRSEIYPAMQRSSSYLRRKNMEVTGYSNGLPIVRQKPGGSNSLGKVKFIFPNSYNIYFHDTPARTLFDKEKRAFSHGCIRLHKPFDLAVYLLKDNATWTDSKIKEAMNSSKEKWVTLAQPVPVFITYFTTWVDGDGILYFMDDIYGHDANLASHLFE